jgi:hypothetical protein
MKNIVLGTILSLLAVASFAGTQEVATTPVAPASSKASSADHQAKHAAIKAALQECKGSVPAGNDKKATHTAVKSCMEAKGFKGHRHHKRADLATPADQAPVTK